MVLLVGVPCSGKSWVTSQLTDKYVVVEHDDYRDLKAYVAAIVAVSGERKPVLANTPFGVTDLLTSLQSQGLSVEPVFIIESENVLKARYSLREGKPIPQGHLTRQNTYKARAEAYTAFVATSQEVFTYLSKRKSKP